MKKVFLILLLLIVSFQLLLCVVFAAPNPAFGRSEFGIDLSKKENYYLNQYSMLEVGLKYEYRTLFYVRYSVSMSETEFNRVSPMYLSMPQSELYPLNQKNGNYQVESEKRSVSWDSGFASFKCSFVVNLSGYIENINKHDSKNSLYYYMSDVGNEKDSFNLKLMLIKPSIKIADEYIAKLVSFEVGYNIGINFLYELAFSQRYNSSGFSFAFGRSDSNLCDMLSLEGANSHYYRFDEGITLFVNEDPCFTYVPSTTTNVNNFRSISHVFEYGKNVIERLKFRSDAQSAHVWIDRGGETLDGVYTSLAISFVNFYAESMVSQTGGVTGANSNYVSCDWFDIPCHLGNAVVYLLYNFPLTSGVFNLFKTVYGAVDSTIAFIGLFSGLGILFTVFIVFFILRLARWLTG